MKVLLLFWIKYDSAHTSVGHEDLQASILQQVTPSKHGSDLTEHPFPMQPLGECQHLNTHPTHQKCTISFTNSDVKLLRRNTHLCISLLKSRIFFIHLKVNLSGGDRERPLGNNHRSDQLGRRAQNHRTLERSSHLLHLFHKTLVMLPIIVS